VNFDVARAELVNMLKLRAQNLLNLLMAHVCADLQCLALAGRVVDLPHRLSRGPKPQP
jgi:hypothetical protein